MRAGYGRRRPDDKRSPGRHVTFTVRLLVFARVSDVGRSRGLRELETELRDLREALLAAEVSRADEIEAAHPLHRRSAANLVHYVELRNHDLRELQPRLGALGLSSLGRCEPYVLATIEAVLALLARLTGGPPPTATATVALTEGHDLLARNADRLLGLAPVERSTRIMVTMPSEAADDPQLVAGLMANGMDVARINCAHDDVAAWARMIVVSPIELRSRRPASSDRDGPGRTEAANRTAPAGTTCGADRVRSATGRDAWSNPHRSGWPPLASLPPPTMPVGRLTVVPIEDAALGGTPSMR